MGYRRILAAIDLSEEADDVLDKAKEVAAQNEGARLAIVSVIKPLNHVYGGFDAAALSAETGVIEQEAIKQTEKRLGEAAAKLGVDEKSAHVARGNPAAEIKRVAEELGTDLIIMGTHGRHGLGLLLGSTATGVLHGVPCDVLAIKVSSD